MRAYLRPSEVVPGVAGAARAESPQESALTVEDMIRAGVGHDRGGNYALPPEASSLVSRSETPITPQRSSAIHLLS